MDKGKLFLVALACLTVAAAEPHNYNYEQSAPSLKWKVETMSAAEDRPETMSAAEDRPETMSAAEDRPETM
ncbi:hypothetical protein RRG08_027903 [Elysia crispata]|uniref:Uncharacterized protein n=1 Tax=Elysia crispata TaxID=231223 RepID=A0AAE1DU25_9GAST|nr:hypothetical protein RRG08_027903 [Elysia crispata]